VDQRDQEFATFNGQADEICNLAAAVVVQQHREVPNLLKVPRHERLDRVGPPFTALGLDPAIHAVPADDLEAAPCVWR